MIVLITFGCDTTSDTSFLLLLCQLQKGTLRIRWDKLVLGDIEIAIVLKLLALTFKLVAVLGFNNLVVGVIAILCTVPASIVDIDQIKSFIVLIIINRVNLDDVTRPDRPISFSGLLLICRLICC